MTGSTARGLRLGSIARIEIAADWSLLIIFALITFSLAMGVFPQWHPDWSSMLYWSTALAAAVLFFASVLLHELSHAIVGRANGIDVRRITLFMFGGIAHMESEPPSWRAELGMAVAGPLTSLALGAVFLGLASLVSGPLDIDPENIDAALAPLGPLATLLLWLGPINVVLGLFNLVPGFPLDGGRVLRALMWGISGNLELATRYASRAGRAFAWLLMACGIMMMLGLRVPVFGAGFGNGLWLALIGWFLNNAALMSYRQLVIHEVLEAVPIRRLMQTRYTSIDPQMRVDALVDEHLMASGQRAFPVVAGGRFLGIVSLGDLRKRARDAWQTTKVSEIMTPAAELVTAEPEQDAFEALALIGQRDLNQLPVVSRGELLGLLRREDVLKWLSLQTESEQRHAVP